MNIYDIINRARSLKEEYRLDSVTPERLGALHEDTLKYINEYQLLASSPAIHKTYASISAMQSSSSPKSDLTGKPLKAGQLVVIVPADPSDSTAGDVYRYDGPSGNTSKWTFVAKIGAVPADAELSATSTNPPQNQAVTAKLTELESKVSVSGLSPKNIDISWSKGYVSDTGEIKSSSLAVFSQPIKIKRGELVIVGTDATNVGIFSKTTSDSLSVGDNVELIRLSPSESGYRFYSFSPYDDTEIVLCARESDKQVSFFTIDDKQLYDISKISDAQNVVISYDGTIDTLPDKIVFSAGTIYITRTGGDYRAVYLNNSLSFILDGNSYIVYDYSDNSIKSILRTEYSAYRHIILFRINTDLSITPSSYMMDYIRDKQEFLISEIKQANSEIENLMAIPQSFLFTGDVTLNDDYITFNRGDFYVIFKDGTLNQFYITESLKIQIEAWSQLVYNRETNTIVAKLRSDIDSSVECILASFDAEKNIFPGGFLFPLLSRNRTQPYVAYTANVEVYDDCIQFQRGDFYAVSGSKYKAIYIADDSLKFALKPNMTIAYKCSSNTIEEIAVSEYNEFDTWLLLRTDKNSRILNVGLMPGYILMNPVRFYKGYINWEDGKYQANEQRLYTNRYKFDHDVYIGFIKPIYDTASNVFLTQRIYLYENGEYKGLYMSPTGRYDSRTSYTTEEVFIPKNTEFAIVLKYSDESNPVIPIDELLSQVRNRYCISETPISQIIPDYYFRRYVAESGASYNYIDDKVSHIDSVVRDCSMNGDAFIFITDVHYDRNQKHSPALIKYINEQVNIPRMFNGGDDYDGGYFNVYNVFESCFKGDFYYGVGNHDVDEYGVGGAYPLATYNNLLATHYKSKSYDKAVFGNYAKCYYYVDNQVQKIRYITLNSIGSQEHNYKPYDEEQLDWLKNVALDVEDGWTIIIFSHIVLIRKGTEYELQINDHAQRMLNVLESYDGNGIIAGVFCGDDHTDRVYRTPIKNIPVILTTTDGTARKDIAESPVGTINEQAFEVVGINKTEKKFTLVRVGRKAWNGVGLYDRGEQVEFREVYY